MRHDPMLSPAVQPLNLRIHPNMKNSLRNVAAPTLLALAFFTTSAWAQMAAPSTPASSSMAARAQKHQDAVEQRITQLHSELNITSAQQPQWDTFAQAMRDSAQKADQ